MADALIATFGPEAELMSNPNYESFSFNMKSVNSSVSFTATKLVTRWIILPYVIVSYTYRQPLIVNPGDSLSSPSLLLYSSSTPTSYNGAFTSISATETTLTITRSNQNVTNCEGLILAIL